MDAQPPSSHWPSLPGNPFEASFQLDPYLQNVAPRGVPSGASSADLLGRVQEAAAGQRASEALVLRYQLAALHNQNPPDSAYDAISNWVTIANYETRLGNFDAAQSAHAVAVFLIRKTSVPRAAHVTREIAKASAAAQAMNDWSRGRALLQLAQRELIDAQGQASIQDSARAAVLYAFEVQAIVTHGTPPVHGNTTAHHRAVADYLIELAQGLLTSRTAEDGPVSPAAVYLRCGQLEASLGDQLRAGQCYGSAANVFRDRGEWKDAYGANLMSAEAREAVSRAPAYAARYWAAAAAARLKDRALFNRAVAPLPYESIDDPHYFVMFVFAESEAIRMIDKDYARAARFVDAHLPRATALNGFVSSPDDMPNGNAFERATIPYLGALFANRIPLDGASESSRIADAVTAARLYARGIRDGGIDIANVVEGGGHEHNLQLVFRELARYTYSGAAVVVARDQALEYLRDELQGAVLEQVSELTATAASSAYDFAMNLIGGFTS